MQLSVTIYFNVHDDSINVTHASSTMVNIKGRHAEQKVLLDLTLIEAAYRRLVVSPVCGLSVKQHGDLPHVILRYRNCFQTLGDNLATP